MTHQEFIRLCGYSKAQKKSRQIGWKGTTKRSAKKGRIMVLKNSRITSEVHTETCFPWQQHQKPLMVIREPYVKKVNRKK